MKENFSKIKISKISIIIFLAILNLVFGSFFLDLPKITREDSVTYETSIMFLNSESNGEEVYYNRILTTPFLLYSASVIDSVIDNVNYSVIAVNVVLYLLTIFFFYKLVFEVYKKEKIAFIATLLLMFNFYFFTNAYATLADVGGWSFFIISSYFGAKFFNTKNNKFFLYAILASSIGVMFKEYGALGMVTLGMFVLISDTSLKEKFRRIVLAGAIFLILPIMYHIYFYFKYNYTYFDWYTYNVDNYGPNSELNTYNLALLIKVLGWVYLAGWPLFLWGAFKEFKAKNKERQKKLLALLPASIAFLAWPAFLQRVAVILIPWTAMISSYGLSKLKKHWVVVILILYILVNYNINYLIKVINL